MALNFPGPYEVRIFYSVPVGTVTLVHEQRLNIDLDAEPTLGQDFSTIIAKEVDGGTNSLQLVVTNWIAILAQLHNPATTFINAELWKYEPLSFESSFVSTFDLNTPGAAGGSIQPASQLIWTFRTGEGGIMKISMLETVIPPGVSISYPAQTAQEKAVVDSVLGAANCWLARDTSYPFAAIQLHPGQNEAVFKKRYRA